MNHRKYLIDFEQVNNKLQNQYNDKPILTKQIKETEQNLKDLLLNHYLVSQNKKHPIILAIVAFKLLSLDKFIPLLNFIFEYDCDNFERQFLYINNPKNDFCQETLTHIFYTFVNCYHKYLIKLNQPNLEVEQIKQKCTILTDIKELKDIVKQIKEKSQFTEVCKLFIIDENAHEIDYNEIFNGIYNLFRSELIYEELDIELLKTESNLIEFSLNDDNINQNVINNYEEQIKKLEKSNRNKYEIFEKAINEFNMIIFDNHFGLKFDMK